MGLSVDGIGMVKWSKLKILFELYVFVYKDIFRYLMSLKIVKSERISICIVLLC